MAARHYLNEDAYLNAMHQFVSQVAEDPVDYLDGWNLFDDYDADVFGTKATQLAEEIMQVMTTPLAMRGPVPEY